MTKAEQGNTVSRLKRERPDLFKQVADGKLSANAAAIEAGFRKTLTPFERDAHPGSAAATPKWRTTNLLD